MTVPSISESTGFSNLSLPSSTKSPAPSHSLGVWPLAVLAVASVAVIFLAPSVSNGQQASGKLVLKTTAFQPGGNIPKQFTCDGADASPALSWSDPPPGTRSFTLIMDDPDAPGATFVHWVVYNLPPSTRHLPERVQSNGEMRSGGMQGVNDFPKTGYGGPCPPPGKPHRYFYRLYALDSMLNLKARAKEGEVERAMKGHVLAQAELLGMYGR